MVLQEYEVYVNNELENRRGRKLYANDVIEIQEAELSSSGIKGSPLFISEIQLKTIAIMKN